MCARADPSQIILQCCVHQAHNVIASHHVIIMVITTALTSWSPLWYIPHYFNEAWCSTLTHKSHILCNVCKHVYPHLRVLLCNNCLCKEILYEKKYHLHTVPFWRLLSGFVPIFIEILQSETARFPTMHEHHSPKVQPSNCNAIKKKNHNTVLQL